MPESYRRWRLPQLWEMVAADNADDVHLHLATLRRQQTALETQRDRLRVLRDQLIEAWPPQKSEAATAFVQRLNDMIDAFTATARGAAEVRGGVQIVADAINLAREQLTPLVERYTGPHSVADPRVVRQAQKLIDEDARGILMAADLTVRDATTKFDVALPAYGRISMQTDIPPVDGGTNSPGGAAPGSGNARSGVSRLSGRPPQFAPPSPVHDGTAGEEVLLAEDPAGVGVNSLQSTDLGVLQGQGGATKGYQVPMVGIGRVLGSPPPIGNLSGTEAIIRDVGSGALRSATGNVIGGAPAASSAGSARVRPMQATPSSSRPAQTTSRQTAGGGKYQDRSFEQNVTRQRGPAEDGGEQWTVNRGVTPVLEAAPPGRIHDPGPGVIGLDR